MHVITAQNVNDAFLSGMLLLKTESNLQETRNGPAYVCPEPVTTHYRYPTQRVLFSPERDANPFFHLLEALWMLGGCRDVKRMAWLVPRMAQYSDNGETFHAAYGHRWRHWGYYADADGGTDQIAILIEQLKQNPRSRRAILQMWHPYMDLADPPEGAKDLPCNTTIKFSIETPPQPEIDMADPIGGTAFYGNKNYDPRLNMVVFNRSNDIIMGCYGANAVHLSVLQEYVASMLGVRVGWYEQVSCDYHAYQTEYDELLKKLDDSHRPAMYPNPINPYTEFGNRQLVIRPLVDDPATFDKDLQSFLGYWEQNDWRAIGDFYSQENPFFTVVASNMLFAYWLYRSADPTNAYKYLDNMVEDHGRIDWLVAGREWMRRRVISRERKILDQAKVYGTERSMNWPDDIDGDLEAQENGE